MKKLILLPIVLVLCLQVKAQNTELEKANHDLKERGELFFFVPKLKKDILPELCRILSVDQPTDSGFYCYANPREFELYQKLELPFQVMLPASLQEPVRMSSGLKSTDEWDAYPTHGDYVAKMKAYAENYPSICKLDTIGFSVKKRPLLVVKISDQVEQDETEPEFFYTSTMHGDEPVGYVLSLRLIDYLLTNYETDPYVKSLVDSVEIWINPLANPDGSYRYGDNSVSGATRYNANGVDLNRNFPYIFTEPERPRGYYQPETSSMMKFHKERKIVLSANMHEGIELLNYPWDTVEELHADNDWFYQLSRDYVDTVQVYSDNYMDRNYSNFDNGVTNGYAWYDTQGSRQDYATYYSAGREITFELSEKKVPSASKLPGFWDYNYRSLLQYIEKVKYGVHGLVTDADTKQAVKAKIELLNYDDQYSVKYSDENTGEYHRLLLPGSYVVEVTAEGYVTQKTSFILEQEEYLELPFELKAIATGIDDALSGGVSLYPNPVQNTFYVKGEDLTESCWVELMDMSGRLVKRESYREGFSMDVSDLLDAIYVVQVKNGAKTIMRTKLIVAKK